MAKLKIGTIEDDKPVTVTIKLPGRLHRDLVAYAEIMKGLGERQVDPTALVAPMLDRFMATDRVFKKMRRAVLRSPTES